MDIRQTDRHVDSMTDPAQRAQSVKMIDPPQKNMLTHAQKKRKKREKKPFLSKLVIC